MGTSLEVHPLQANILKILLFKTEGRFRDLNSLSAPTDQFNFHLKALLKGGLLERTPKGLYRLTSKGKEFANRFDTEKGVIERQPKIGVAVSCLKKEESGVKYLVQQRLKHPYYGYFGIISGKVRWGDTIFDTARRELSEETGLTVRRLKLTAVEHKMDYSKEGSLLEDKIFFIFLGFNPSGDLVKEFEGGRNMWMPEKEILSLNTLFDDVPQILNTFKKSNFSFLENKFTVNKY